MDALLEAYAEQIQTFRASLKYQELREEAQDGNRPCKPKQAFEASG
jgi:hypothetical protein